MIAIIPARSGSKSIKNKNIKNFFGKPLIFWTIDAAIKSKKINRIFISTDSKFIANMCLKYSKKVEVPFLRPKHLSNDNSPALKTYIYMSKKLNKIGISFDEFIVLLPTSPLRTSSDIDKSIKIFYKNKPDSVISCVKPEHPYHWYLKKNHNNRLKEIFKKESLQSRMNSQQNQNLLIPNGAIYILISSIIKKKNSYYTNNTLGYLMSKKNSIDINNLFDFDLAESIIKKNNVN